MITYPKIPSESVVFREKFTNDTYVADNGVTLYNSPTIDNGMALNGSSQYAEADSPKIPVGDFTLTVGLTPSSVTGTTDIVGQYVGGAAGRLALYHVSGQVYLRIGGTAYGTGSTNLFIGQTAFINVVKSGTNCKVYIDGNQTPVIDETYTDDVLQSANMQMGLITTNYFPGTILRVDVQDKALTAAEIADRFAQITFTEPTPENSEIWLPLRTHYYDTGVTKEVTPNLGNINSDQIWWGNGVDAATQPTQLSPNGIYCASGASPDYVRTPKTFTTTVGESYSFSCLAQPTGTLAGNDYLFSVKQGLSEGLSLAILSANGKMTFFCDGGVGLVDDTTMGEGAGLYHIAFVLEYNGANYDSYLYKDGELVDSSLGHAGFTPAAGNAMIAVGADYDGGQGFQGNIHFPIFMRTALTLTQIKWLHQRMFNELNI